MTDYFDPRGEYTRICPYCRESFVADHLSRFYCPDKFGRKNYCKNRQKRIMDTIRKDGEVVLEHEKNPLKVFIEAPIAKKNNIDELVKDSQKELNCKILCELLGSKNYVEATEIELIKIGFILECFDSSENTVSEVKIFFLDKYGFNKNLKNNTIYITLKQSYYGTK